MKTPKILLLGVPFLLAFSLGNSNSLKKILPESFVEIPKGAVYTFTQTTALTKIDVPDAIMDSCETFYILDHEVTNAEYKLFLDDLRRQNRMAEYHKNLPDTTVWRKKVAYSEPFVELYFRHPAHNKYPVVGISIEQAKAYAAWLTESRLNVSEKYKVTYSVPTRNQWIRAARGEKKYDYSLGPRLRNSKCAALYNFKNLGERNIHYDEQAQKYVVIPIYIENSDGNLITTEAKSYFPNDFGVYNMCGNVAEIISDADVAMGGSWNNTGYDIRVESEQKGIPSSTVGFRVVATISSK